MKTLILYSKPGCHLCEGLQEKLESMPIQLEVRDITQNEVWFQKYQYEVPVVCYPIQVSEEAAEGSTTGSTANPTVGTLEKLLPRLSPRASVKQVAKIIQTHIGTFES
ncbi:MAG: glutaredoxin family protein [Phormidesmis sp.]